jgi:hypothetical protein
MPLPPLRQLDISPIEYQGENYFSLRDPEGFVEDALVLTPFAFFVAAHLDGVHEMVDIQQSFAQRTGGQLLMSEDVSKVVEILDAHGFLLTDRYLEIRRETEASYAQGGARTPHFAGKSYPAEAEALRTFLDGMFLGQDGPGTLPSATCGEGAPVRCLVVPHIDFHRGAAAYARGYLEMFRRGKPDTVFVFGVAHMAPPVPFMLTRKAYDTPFGTLEPDREALAALEASCEGWDPYEFEIAHRTEHSIEFQAVMLAYLYGPSVRIVPILCGPLCGETDGFDGAFDDAVETFLAACHAYGHEPGRRVSVIAGADLAHVGKRFGDSFDVSPEILARVEARDREDLSQAAQGNAASFYTSVMKDGNERRVCGLHCIYSALRVAAPVTGGELLHYGHAPDPAGGIVSFADLLFT